MKLIPLEIQCSQPMPKVTTFITEAIVNYSYDGKYALGKDMYAQLMLDYAVHTIRYGKLASIYSEVNRVSFQSEADSRGYQYFLGYLFQRGKTKCKEQDA